MELGACFVHEYPRDPAALKAAGIPLEMESDETTAGRARVVIVDPDGNQILIDQHV